MRLIGLHESWISVSLVPNWRQYLALAAIIGLVTFRQQAIYVGLIQRLNDAVRSHVTAQRQSLERAIATINS